MSRKINRSFSLLTVVLLILGVLVIGFTFGYRYVISQNERFSRYDTKNLSGDLTSEENQKIVIDRNTPGAVMVYIRLGDRTSDIAERLKEAGVIDHPILFNLMSKINGFDGGYQYGTHFITKGMTYDEIMYNLTLKPSASNITFREGLTYKQIKQVLREQGVQFDESLMDDIVMQPNKYFAGGANGYLFLDDKGLPKRDWPLQGYLFPDTYSFDLNTDSQTIIQTFLNNTQRRIPKDAYERAKKLGMSMDQVVTLASVIEAEAGNIREMYRVSRVFHNRLAQKMPLQSCATINYVRGERNLPRLLVVSESDLNLDSPYNTYLNAGLPPGPICNPGLEAIRAALYPSIDPGDRELLYFAATGDGNNVFANTFDEHVVNVRKYVLPLAQEQGFGGTLDSKSGAVYSTGGDIVVPTQQP